MPEDLEQLKWLLDYAGYITWPVTTIVVFWLCATSGILGGVSALMRGITDNMRIKDLETFRETAENNHWHDIEDLKDRMAKVEDKVDRIAEDVAYLRGKAGNGYK